MATNARGNSVATQVQPNVLGIPAGSDAASSDVIGLVSWPQLIAFLGGPSPSSWSSSPRPGEEFLITRLCLMPGDNLYGQGPRGRYAYLVESGLLERVGQHADGHDAPHSVSFACIGELVGMHPHLAHRPESVNAVTRTSLLALPLSGLSKLGAEDPLLTELIARPLSMALKRDWRTLYRLRDLPPYARTVAALAHLINLALPGHRARDSADRLPVHLKIERLASWLGLPSGDMTQDLEQLQRHGALAFRHDCLIFLMPDVLLPIESALNLWRMAPSSDAPPPAANPSPIRRPSTQPPPRRAP